MFRREIGRLGWCGWCLLLPFLSDHPQTTDLNTLSVGEAGGFDFETLAIRVAANDKHTDVGSVAFNVLDGFLMGAAVERANEDIGPWLDEPALKHSANSIRSVAGDDNRHSNRPSMSLGILWSSLSRSTRSLSSVRTNSPLSSGSWRMA